MDSPIRVADRRRHHVSPEPDGLASAIRRLIDMIGKTPAVPTVTRLLPHDWRELSELNFRCPACGAVNSIPIMHALAIGENPMLSPWYCWKAGCRQPFRVRLVELG